MCTLAKKSGPKRGVGVDDAQRGIKEPREEDDDVHMRVAVEAQIDTEAEVDKLTS